MRPSLAHAVWDWTSVTLDQTNAADNVDIVAAVAGKRIFVHKIIVGAASGTTTYAVSNGNSASGTNLTKGSILTATTNVIEFPFEAPFACTANTALKFDTSGNNISVTVLYNLV